MKRELLVDELRDVARAVPVSAATAGVMLVPALLFYTINHDGSTMQLFGRI
jgi:Na+/H+ antiporter NhaA